MINKERMLSEFFELVRINCSTKNERQVADLLKTKLAAFGMEVCEDNTGEKNGGNCGNVIAYTKGSVQGATALMLSAHMDCVEPCENIEPELKEGMITSKGNTVLGGDDKAGIAAILEGLRIINEQKIPHGPIQIIFTVGEEGGLDGSKNIDPAVLKADVGYALDSGGAPGEIVTMAPGQNSITAVIHGKAAHAGVAPEDGINAIAITGMAMAEIQYGRIDFETTANIGIISGGVATNIVPDRVVVQCEARSRNALKLEVQTAHMQETFERVAAAHGAHAEVTITKAYEPYVLTEEALVVTLAIEAAQSIQLTPVIKATGGGSDANFFNKHGVPMAVLGVGMSKVHTVDEYIKEVDLYHSAELVVALIKTAGILKK